MYNSKPGSQAERSKLPTDPNAGKVHPDRRWFGPVRTVDQKELDLYRKNLEKNEANKGSGFSVLLKNKKLPLSLVKENLDKTMSAGQRLLQVQSFEDTFGPKNKRKRPGTDLQSLEEMVKKANEKNESYDSVKDKDLHKNDIIEKKDEAMHKIFEKGQSKRIWDELYKVIDSSDVIVIVLDARNPNGTRSYHIEDYLRKKCPTKHLIFVLNKCDLVPTSVT